MDADNWDAYWAGDNAAANDRPLSANPYPIGTPDHVDWTRGWNEARMVQRLGVGYFLDPQVTDVFP